LTAIALGTNANERGFDISGNPKGGPMLDSAGNQHNDERRADS
jgi:hypothetical protein